MTQNADNQVCAVVVTYLPQVKPLTGLFWALVPQVARIFVVDNTPEGDERVVSLCAELGFVQVELIRLGSNLGIAKAFNVGIAAAMSAGATHILLSDQDSEPAPDMVAGLLRAEADLQQRVGNVGAIGPSFTNLNSGEIFPFHVTLKGSLLPARRSATPEQPHVETLNLISSGTLISAAALNAVGMMREDFFIDSVDTEWCYRARARGYRLYGTAWATMHHRMGDSTLRFWFLGWVKGNAHSPLRVYYQVRNLVRLNYLGFSGIRWRVRSVLSIAAIFYCQVFFGNAKIAALQMALRGLLDGLRGRMGEFRP